MAKALVAAVSDRRTFQPPAVTDRRYSIDPFSYTRRPTATIRAGDVALGGEETIRVVVRRETFDQLAHKLDRLGDYQPEIVLEQANASSRRTPPPSPASSQSPTPATST